MRSDYAIWLHRDNGDKIMPLDMAISVEWTSAVNGIGSFEVRLPHDFDFKQIVNDQRISIWRSPPNAAPYREFYGLIRSREWRDTLTTYAIRGYDFNYVLSGRSVLYSASSTQANKVDKPDNLMKQFVRDNIGSGCALAPNTSRQISTTYFTVEADGSLIGTTASRNAYAKNLYEICSGIANDARNSGSDLFFDVVPVTDAKVEFRTYIHQRGSDRTTSGLVFVFSPDFGNVEDPRMVQDATAEANYIYALGNHPNDATNPRSASDSARATATIWSWREKVVDARSVYNNGQRQAIANSELVKGRVKSIFSGTIVNTDAQRYGIDWRLGDKVKISYAGQQYTAMVRTVHGLVDKSGHERIEGGLEVY